MAVRQMCLTHLVDEIAKGYSILVTMVEGTALCEVCKEDRKLIVQVEDQE